MKKIYLLFALIFFMSSCEKEEIIQPIEATALSEEVFREIAFRDLPENILNNFDDDDFLSRAKYKSKSPFGPVNTSIKAKKIKYHKNLSSFTFSLGKANNKTSTNYYFDNLLIKETEKGALEILIIRYEPTLAWQNSTRDFAYFSGKITFFRPTGEKISEFQMKLGKQKNIRELTAKAECYYYLDHITTISTNLGTYHTVYHYIIFCTGGGWDPYSGSGGGGEPGDGPGDPESIPTEPTEGDPDWDYGSGGGGDNPYEEEVVIKVINELDDPCASLIFNQLHLAAINTDLPDRFTDPNNNGNEYFLTEGILSLFNSSSTINYTILNSNLGAPSASTIGSTTSLNNSYLNQATQLSIARTMIHEMLHAYLNLSLSNPLTINNLDFYNLMLKYAEGKGYKPSGTAIEQNRFQHEFMGGYVNAMAYSLYRWDLNHGTGGNLGWNYYFNMASAGLLYQDINGNYIDTDSFKNLFKEDEDGLTALEKQNEAKKIIENEATNNPDAKGSDC